MSQNKDPPPPDYLELFQKLDVNQDGKIDLLDLTAVLKNSGLVFSDSYAKKFLEKSDLDESGDITLEEFVKYAEEREEKLRGIFEVVDVDQDGRICFKELLKVCKSDSETLKIISSIGSGGSISWEDWRDHLLLNPNVESLPDVLSHWKHVTFLETDIPSDLTPQEIGNWWRHLVAGGVAGAVSRTATAPLDRIKVFLQVHGQLSMLGTCRGMIREGGVSSLWRGNGINVIKIGPESALKFMAYEYGKRFLKGEKKSELRIEERFLAGSVAGAVSQSAIYPLEVVKTRLALRRTGQYTGILDIAMKLYKSEGPMIFYRGYLPNLLGILPYAGIELAVYETLKKKIQKNKKEQPNTLILLTCGTCSSACGQLASYPLALVRTRLQANSSASSMSGVFKGIISEEGLRGLYRGLLPNFLKVAPAVSISYVCYERIRLYLGVDMS